MSKEKTDLERFEEIVDEIYELVWGTPRRPEVKFKNMMTKTKPKRARGKKGKFLADDPRTKEFNEAWVSGKAPKRKRRQGNTREDPRPDKPKARPDRQNRTKQVKTRQNKTK